MVLNKKQAMEILTNHSPSASFLANVVAHQPQYRGKAAKYLKFAACLVSHGIGSVQYLAGPGQFPDADVAYCGVGWGGAV